jgi:hypothetical protein
LFPKKEKNSKAPLQKRSIPNQISFSPNGSISGVSIFFARGVRGKFISKFEALLYKIRAKQNRVIAFLATY